MMTEYKDIEQWYNERYKLDQNLIRRHPKSFDVNFRFLNCGQGNNILDVGCGTGELLKVAALKYGLEPYGIDISEEALTIARENLPQGKFTTVKAEEIRYPADTFDNVTCLGVLEHLVNIEQGIQQIGRVAKKSAKIVITVPNRNFIGWLLKKNKGTSQREIKESLFSKREWMALLNQNGLGVERTVQDKGFIYSISDMVKKPPRYYFKRLLWVAMLLLPVSLTYQFIFICSKKTDNISTQRIQRTNKDE